MTLPLIDSMPTALRIVRKVLVIILGARSFHLHFQLLSVKKTYHYQLRFGY